MRKTATASASKIEIVSPENLNGIAELDQNGNSSFWESQESEKSFCTATATPKGNFFNWRSACRITAGCSTQRPVAHADGTVRKVSLPRPEAKMYTLPAVRCFICGGFGGGDGLASPAIKHGMHSFGSDFWRQIKQPPAHV